MISETFTPTYMFYLQLNHIDQIYEINEELSIDVVNHLVIDIYYKKRSES